MTSPKAHRKLTARARVQASWFPGRCYSYHPTFPSPPFLTFSGQVSMRKDTGVTGRACNVDPGQSDGAHRTPVAVLEPYRL